VALSWTQSTHIHRNGGGHSSCDGLRADEKEVKNLRLLLSSAALSSALSTPRRPGRNKQKEHYTWQRLLCRRKIHRESGGTHRMAANWLLIIQNSPLDSRHGSLECKIRGLLKIFLEKAHIFVGLF
jgi:hypothetical protein